MMSSFFQMQSPSGSGSLPSNTIANPRGDLKVITTRSGVSYDGLTFPPTSSPLPKEVELEPEATKDKVQTTSTAHVQPPVVQVPIPEPDVSPKPNPKPSIPYPSRLNDQKLREKANNQMLNLLSNKEKLFELENNPLNENCLAVLLKKLPKKLGNPGKFLIPCDFLELVECLALADLGASINLMPLSVWKKLSLPELTPTLMTLKLANRSVAYPVGVSEDVFMKVGKFHFLADFVVVDYDVDPRVPFILGRPFLRTAQALIDDISKSGNPTPSLDPIITTSFPSLTPFEGDILLLKKLLNNDPSSPLPPKELHFEELKTIKSSIDDPPELELKDLPSHLEYAFSEGTNKLPVIIAKNLKDDEKARLLKLTPTQATSKPVRGSDCLRPDVISLSKKPHWKVVEHVNHKRLSDGGVIVVEEDPDVIHFDNSSDLPLSTSFNDLDNATLHIDGQSTEVDAPPDIIDLNEYNDIIDDKDALPCDLADSDDEDLVNVDDDDGVDVVYSSKKKIDLELQLAKDTYIFE
ncbi:reverse transcriptase domain-containing protein [Tanacetum coccineum]